MADDVCQVLGVEHMRQESEKALRASRDKMRPALTRAGEYLLQKTLPRVPIEFGDLRASGVVSRPFSVGQEHLVNVTFGNDDVNYAGYVHERLDVYHEPPTQAKFLEYTTQVESENLLAIIATGMKF